MMSQTTQAAVVEAKLSLQHTECEPLYHFIVTLHLLNVKMFPVFQHPAPQTSPEISRAPHAHVGGCSYTPRFHSAHTGPAGKRYFLPDPLHVSLYISHTCRYTDGHPHTHIHSHKHTPCSCHTKAANLKWSVYVVF